jgi:hypothetical protein
VTVEWVSSLQRLIVLIVGVLIGWLLTWTFQRPRARQYWATAIGIVVLVTVVYWLVILVFAIVSDPKSFVEDKFVQGLGTVLAGFGGIGLVFATFALVRATKRLDAATEISTHAQTAPQIQVNAWLVHEPMRENEPKNIIYGDYTFASDDDSNREYAAWLSTAVDTKEKAYLVISPSSTQGGSTYATVTNLKIMLTLFFPKDSAIKSGHLQRDFSDLTNYEAVQRTLETPILLPQQFVTLKAARVDAFPMWGFVITGMTYSNHQGETCTSGVGVISGAWDNETRGLVTEYRRYDPQPGEVPRWPKRMKT